MRKLAILTFLSLDGVMQAVSMPGEDTSGGFEHGGWAGPYWQEVMAQVQREAMSEPYDLLLGRKTYELFAAHNAKEPGPNPLNELTKYVVTRTLDTLEWQMATLFQELIEIQFTVSWCLRQPLIFNCFFRRME